MTDRRSHTGAGRRARGRAARLATTGAALSTTLLTTVLAGPASAATHPDDGADPGPSLSGLQTVLIFVVTPLAICAIIALLAAAPSMARGPRYRPGLGWWAAPVWFNGPDDPDSAIRAVEARPAAEVAAISGGGASARW